MKFTPPWSRRAPAPPDPLAPLYRWAGLTILDVGARGGPLTWMARLAPFSRYIACEPMAEEGAATVAASPWAEETLIREALAAKPGTAKLHLTANPGFSSMMAPDGDAAAAYCLGKEMATIGSADVPTITLAQAAQKYGFADLGLIKLDTQGTELEILASGEELLSGPVQAIHIECEFRAFYQGQPLFADIDAYVRGLGFEIIGMEPTSRRRRRGDRLVYSRPEIAWAHVLYVKAAPDPASLGEEAALRAVIRQIAVASALEYFDLAADRLETPWVQAALARAGLQGSVRDLDAFARAAGGRALTRAFPNGAPDVVRHRSPLYAS